KFFCPSLYKHRLFFYTRTRTYVLNNKRGERMRINFDLYRPSETERWISDVYQQNGIYHPRDLSIAAVAEIFNVIIKLYDGPVFAEWEEGSYSFIFLNRNKSLVG